MDNCNGEMDYTHSSRKSWSLLRKLDAAQPTRKVSSVAAGDVANILYKTSNMKPHKNEKIELKREFQEELRSCKENSALMNEFTAEEVYNALKSVKDGKAAGVDTILPEFLKNLGPRSIYWIEKLASKIAVTNVLPRLWRETKVIAILKPKKEARNPKNYCPISLLSTMYKLFERLLLTTLRRIHAKNKPVSEKIEVVVTKPSH
jgi:hypothetical protein